MEIRSFKAYHIKQIKERLKESDQEKQKEIIREHILRMPGSELGASVVDIYVVAYVNQMYGAGREKLGEWLNKHQVTENRNSVGAIWQVG